MDTLSTIPVDLFQDRIKLPFTFDVSKMLAEIQNQNLEDFIYYNVMPLRSPAHLVDSSLPFPPPAEDFADGTWTDWMDTPILKACPYLREVINTFSQHTQVNLVRLLRLAPGAEVKEHTDPTLGIHITKSVIRLTIPIVTNNDVSFYLNNEIVPLQPGECWYLRLTDPHRITNWGTTERINMSIDMIPNEWVYNVLKEAQMKNSE